MTTYAADDLELDGMPVRRVDDVEQLRAALAMVLAYAETGQPLPGHRVRAWRELAGVRFADGATPLERRDEGTARAARKWTEEEVAEVDRAIRHVTRAVLRHAAENPVFGDPGPAEFTADNVWRELGPAFPVTKGLTGRLVAAVHAGVIRNTGRTVIADRGGDHDHGQRLTVWQALGSTQ